MQRCTRCIMPETVPGIAFDKNGVCAFCTDYKKAEYSGEEALQSLFSAAKKKGMKYDCIVPLSGGRDSTFILYMAKAVYGLRVLAVSYDNEFKTEQSFSNMKNACDILGVDLEIVRSKRDVAQKIVRCGIISALSEGPYGVADSFCFACASGCRSAVYRAAHRDKVPLILWGASPAESTMGMQHKIAANNESARSRRFLDVNSFFNKLYILLHRLEFPVAGNSLFARGKPVLKDNTTQEIAFFNYIPWDRKKIKDTIINELNWIKPEGSISTWRTDCSLVSLVNYCFFKYFGCSKACFGYVNMINSGQMTREEALWQEEEMLATYSNDIRELLEEKIRLPKKAISLIESF